MTSFTQITLKTFRAIKLATGCSLRKRKQQHFLTRVLPYLAKINTAKKKKLIQKNDVVGQVLEGIERTQTRHASISSELQAEVLIKKYIAESVDGTMLQRPHNFITGALR